MTSVAGVGETIRGIFLRPSVDRPGSGPVAPARLPENVVVLRAEDAPRRREAAKRMAAVAPPRNEGDLAPSVAMVDMAGESQRWLAVALAAGLRRACGTSIAIVAAPTEAVATGPADGESRLKLGGARLLLPFEADRRGAGVIAVDATAAMRHERFLRALGPMVWGIDGVERGREALSDIAGRIDAIVLARPVQVDPAYSEILAGEVEAQCGRCGVVRVVVGREHERGAIDAGCQVAGELALPAGAVDRWRVERGLNCGPAARRALDELAAAILDGLP